MPSAESNQGVYSFLVEIFNGMYRGHVPIRLVAIKTKEKIPKRTAAAPVSTFAKISTPITSAADIRIILSVFPIFFTILNLQFKLFPN